MEGKTVIDETYLQIAHKRYERAVSQDMSCDIQGYRNEKTVHKVSIY